MRQELKTSITITRENETIFTDLIKEFKVFHDTGIVEVEISKAVLPYIKNEVKRYLKLGFKYIQVLTSEYLVKFYENIILNADKTNPKEQSYIFYLDNLNELLNYPYKDFINIRQRILDISVEQFIRHGLFKTFRYEPITDNKSRSKGRKKVIAVETFFILSDEVLELYERRKQSKTLFDSVDLPKIEQPKQIEKSEEVKDETEKKQREVNKIATIKVIKTDKISPEGIEDIIKENESKYDMDYIIFCINKSIKEGKNIHKYFNNIIKEDNVKLEYKEYMRKRNRKEDKREDEEKINEFIDKEKELIEQHEKERQEYYRSQYNSLSEFDKIKIEEELNNILKLDELYHIFVKSNNKDILESYIKARKMKVLESLDMKFADYDSWKRDRTLL